MKLSLNLLALAIFPMCSVSQARDFDAVKKSGKIKICYILWRGADTNKDQPSPYLEMAKEFSKHHKLKITLKEISWDDQFKDQNGQIDKKGSYSPAIFEKDKCDLLPNNLAPLEWRKKLMNITPILASRRSIVVKKDRLDEFSTINDLKGKKTAVVPNTSYYKWIKETNASISNKKEKIKVEQVKKGGTLTKLLNEEVDFVVFGMGLALFSKVTVSKDIEIAFPVGKALYSSWGTKKNTPQFKKAIHEFFNSERKKTDSKLNPIFKKYFGIDLNEYLSLQTIVASE